MSVLFMEILESFGDYFRSNRRDRSIQNDEEPSFSTDQQDTPLQGK